MTPEQEATDKKNFLWLFYSGWVAFGLILVLGYVFVHACRQADLIKIEKMLEKDRCTCETSNKFQQNGNHINIERQPTPGDLAKSILQKQGKVNAGDM